MPRGSVLFMLPAPFAVIYAAIAEGWYFAISDVKFNPSRREKLRIQPARCPDSTPPQDRHFPASTQRNVSGLRQRQPLAGGTERVEAPYVLRLVVPQDEKVSVFGSNTEIDSAGGIPLVLHFHDFEYVPAKGKTDRALVGSIPGIAFDAHFAHRSPPVTELYMQVVYS
jgi:hypothetical protein